MIGRTFVALFVTLLVAVPAVAQTRAIRFAKVWDGTRTISDAVVVIENDRITSVGSGAGAVPKGVQIVDLRKYTGIPGLIDLHTHITYYWDRRPGTRPRGVQRLPPVTVYLAQDNARVDGNRGDGRPADLCLRTRPVVAAERAADTRNRREPGRRAREIGR